MQVYRFVITGGPCAGKSEAVEALRTILTGEGFRVLCFHETATELILSGIAPWTCRTRFDYQRCQLSLQLAKERVFDQAASLMQEENVIILYDRGALDTGCYISHEELTSILEELGTNEEEVMRHYDAVFHLNSTARGLSSVYSLQSNAARTENAEEAAQLDLRIEEIWSHHPAYVCIPCETDFESKIRNLSLQVHAAMLASDQR